MVRDAAVPVIGITRPRGRGGTVVVVGAVTVRTSVLAGVSVLPPLMDRGKDLESGEPREKRQEGGAPAVVPHRPTRPA